MMEKHGYSLPKFVLLSLDFIGDVAFPYCIGYLSKGLTKKLFNRKSLKAPSLLEDVAPTTVGTVSAFSAYYLENMDKYQEKKFVERINECSVDNSFSK